METFTPSLNWSDELVTSLLWVAKGWAIAAVRTVVILALLGGGQWSLAPV
jgi:putative ATP-binding cassette transporter